MDGVRKSKAQLEMKLARSREDKKVFSKYIGSKRQDKENKGSLLNGTVSTMQSKLLFRPQFPQVYSQVSSSSLSLVADEVWECSITHSRGRYC